MIPESPEQVQSAADLLAYVLEYQDVIFVREQVNGSWCSLSLLKAPADVRARHIMRFLEEGIFPVRLKREGERQEDDRED